MKKPQKWVPMLVWHCLFHGPVSLLLYHFSLSPVLSSQMYLTMAPEPAGSQTEGACQLKITAKETDGIFGGFATSEVESCNETLSLHHQ